MNGHTTEIGKGERMFTLITSTVYVSVVLFLCFASSTLFQKFNQDIPQFFLSIRIDHWVHFLMFLPFPFFFYLVVTYFFEGTFLSRFTPLSAFFCGILFAAFTEAVQTLLIPTREGELSDIIADASGILVCSFIMAVAGKFILKTIGRMFN